MKTMKVYFDIPEKRCVVLLEVDITNYSSEEMKKNVSKMMGSEAIHIDAKTYQKLKKAYGD